MEIFSAHMAECTPSSIGTTASQVMLPHVASHKNNIDCHFMGLQRDLHTDLEVCRFSVIKVLHHRLEQLRMQMAVQPCGQVLQ